MDGEEAPFADARIGRLHKKVAQQQDMQHTEYAELCVTLLMQARASLQITQCHLPLREGSCIFCCQ